MTNQKKIQELKTFVTGLRSNRIAFKGFMKNIEDIYRVYEKGGNIGKKCEAVVKKYPGLKKIVEIDDKEEGCIVIILIIIFILIPLFAY